MLELIQNNLFEIVSTIILGIVSYLGAILKQKCEEYIDNQTKKSIVDNTVRYVEQIYKDLHGSKKLEKAKEKAGVWLKEKGITISDTELEILIEASVNEFNDSFGGANYV